MSQFMTLVCMMCDKQGRIVVDIAQRYTTVTFFDKRKIQSLRRVVPLLLVYIMQLIVCTQMLFVDD